MAETKKTYQTVVATSDGRITASLPYDKEPVLLHENLRDFADLTGFNMFTEHGRAYFNPAHIVAVTLLEAEEDN